MNEKQIAEMNKVVASNLAILTLNKEQEELVKEAMELVYMQGLMNGMLEGSNEN